MQELESKVKIPIAIQLVCDDIGWFNGSDDRCEEGPSRTGIPRRHVPEDYFALNEVGKRVNMQIYCPFVIGEWDKDNILRGMEHATPDENEWDMKSKIDMDLAERCFDAIEKCENIEFGFHGLLHGYWTRGIHIADSEFYVPKSENYPGKYSPLENLVPASSEYLESHIEAFFKIYQSWGFKKKIRAFSSPSGMYSDMEANLSYAETIKKYGMIYWENAWRNHSVSDVLGGVAFLNNGGSIIPWNAYDVNAELLPDYKIDLKKKLTGAEMGCIGTHWPNYLRYDPSKSLDNVVGWVNYLKRQGDVFGQMLSRDIAFAESQAIYFKNAKLSFKNNICEIDVSGADAQGAIGLSDEFFISFASDISPKEICGGELSLYERQKGFNTYKIKRNGTKKIEITVKL